MVPAGGSASPATSKAHPKMHIAVARRQTAYGFGLLRGPQYGYDIFAYSCAKT